MNALAGIADAADENRTTHFSWAHRGTAGMRAFVDDHVVMTDSGLVCDTFNTISRVRFTRPGDPRRVREAISWFSEEMRPFSWWVGPADYPTDLGTILVDEGLRPTERYTTMFADLAALAEPNLMQGRLEIRRVESVSQLKTSATISAARKSPPDPLVQRFYDLAAERLLMARCPIRFYLGYLDGVPVASSELTITGRVAGVYHVCTLPAYRRQGIGTAMTLAAMQAGLLQGCFVGVMNVVADEEGLFERAGFESYGRIVEYKLNRDL